MSLEEELSNLTSPVSTLLTIGVFDGVHLGHQKLLAELVTQARQQCFKSGVITFRNHPLSTLGDHNAPVILASFEDKNRLITSSGVDFIVHLEFSQALAGTGARDFCLLLRKYMNMQGLVLGFDFAMGRNREGTLEIMQSLGQELGFGVDIVPPLIIDAEIVSSTSIRQAVTTGNIVKANAQLGRPYSLSGIIVAGKGIGRQLGFPTANIEIDPRYALPANGIYAGFACLDSHRLMAAVNMGTGPTLGGQSRQLEVHLLDFEENIYGQKLRIELIKRTRDELKFDTRQQLVEQIARDVAEIRNILKEYQSNEEK